MEIDASPTSEEIAFVDAQLEAFNTKTVGRDDFAPLDLVIRQDNVVVGGLKALTGWNWLYIKVLWVDSTHRKQGLGSQLLMEAETISKTKNCIGSCLSSFCFQAPDFYRRHGYEEFGRIEAYPDDKVLYFMSKRYA